MDDMVASVVVESERSRGKFKEILAEKMGGSRVQKSKSWQG